MAGIEIHDNVKTEPEHIYTAIELKANQGLDGANERPKLTHEVDDTTKVSKYVCMTHTKQKMLLLVCVIACIMLSIASLIVTTVERDEAIDGSLNGWAQWGACSSTCDVGMQMRQRSCSNPYPSGNGHQCFGADIEQRLCYSDSCSEIESVDGSWSAWNSWEACSTTCNIGIQTRNRNCSNSAPSGNGRQCLGVDSEQRLCKLTQCSDIWFRTTVGIGKASATAWGTGNGATNDEECLNLRKDGCRFHYRDPRIDKWSQQKISKVRYSIYKNGQEVVWVMFNATGSTMNNWFDKSRVIGSSYSDLTSSAKYIFFAINDRSHNLDRVNRHWYVCYEWGGFSDDDIWFVTEDDTGDCHYDVLAPYPYIMYSMNQTRANTKRLADFGFGDVAVVKVIQEE